MRKPIIAGNWKMNKTIAEAVEFVNEIKGKLNDESVDAVICAPFTILKDLKEVTKGTNIKVGAQNMHFADNGAFTGEVSPAMLKELDIDYVVIGHSERREYFNETDEALNKKVKVAFAHNLIPILCCGETLEQREGGVTNEVVGAQIKADLAGLDKELAEISSKASIEASAQLEERLKKLVEKREEYVNTIFTEVKNKLVEFVNSSNYLEYLTSHVKAVSDEYQMTDCVLCVRKEDLKYADDLKKAYALPIEVEEGQQIQLGGFIIENKTTNVVVDESLDSNLEAQKDWFYRTSGLMIK